MRPNAADLEAAFQDIREIDLRGIEHETTDVAELKEIIRARERVIKQCIRSMGYLVMGVSLAESRTLPHVPSYSGADPYSNEQIDELARTRFAYSNRLETAFRSLRKMSKALLTAEPVDKSLLEKIDKTFCACIGLQLRSYPRMRLLEAIYEAALDDLENDSDYHIRLALALSALDQPITPAQQELVANNPGYMDRLCGGNYGFFENKSVSRAFWEGLLSDLRRRANTYERVRYHLAYQYPEHAARLTENDVKQAVGIWTARGTRRSTKERPLKWDFLAGLMAKVGLGRVSAKTLEQEWYTWSKHRSESLGKKA